MKIDPVNKSDAIAAYLNKTGSANGKAAPEMTVSDSVELSPGAKEELRMAEIMDSINNQSYTVPTDDVVSRIMSGVIGKL